MATDSGGLRNSPDDPERFIPLGEYFEARSERSGNPQPIGFAGSLQELVLMVLPGSVSAR